MNKYININKDGKYEINSGLPEFGYELISTIPYAYHLYEKGLLASTTSGLDTSCFYTFSPSHTEINAKRSWENCVELKKAKFSNMEIHRNELEWTNFSPPAIKDFYKDKAIRYKKPTVIISNRKNNEWSGVPINYFSNIVIEKLFKLLSDRYQIVYIDSEYFGADYEDHMPFQSNNINDNIFKKYNVITLKDLKSNYKNLSVNEIQCRLYAGCDKFISSNGGLGILASYFGGENIIFSKMCHELNSDINSFYHWYPKLSKAIIKVVNSEEHLLELVKQKWIDDLPLINIIITTKDNPNGFHNCIVSILEQSYPNINIIVGVHNAESRNYVIGHDCTIVEMYGDAKEIYTHEYLLSLASTGYRILLDDTYIFDVNSIANVVKKISNKTQTDIADLAQKCFKYQGTNDIIIKDQPTVYIVINFKKPLRSLDVLCRSLLEYANTVYATFNYKILIGVYAYKFKVHNTKELVIKYGHKIKFYCDYRNNQYQFINDLLKKIKRRDSLVFFVSQNDILTADVLEASYDKACNLIKQNGFKGVLDINTISVDSKYINENIEAKDIDYSKSAELIKSNHYDKVLPQFVSAILNSKADEYSIDMLKLMSEYLNPSNSKLDQTNRTNSFMCTYQTLEALGLFHDFEFGQDIDFKNRAKLMFGKEYQLDKQYSIIRRLEESSYNHANEQKYENIIKKNADLIKKGILVADGNSVTINKLL
ncbi:hypothetical protein BZ13_850 [Francisella philomiragia subsp. philomiragia ATCC 25015]|uniref:hypothetical protein n=1 Tax=Francisella philomiragia TaxID=28110 RepID=UPI0001AF7891|nr:hypothetical protein [Francisella philomiragia]AJI74700.1 hypothetical protein BZ13_850 [Francisella philomiragia subsp. philomiragia ATCC 25015]EET20928.1 predicted protein [Francisella philomiragia subsp. philomiragia ATCC 25015]MBK2238182.1 hypothetical protein [Francisella philomiragia]